MSKIAGAVREIYRMDEIAARDTWLNHIHPLIKLIITVLYIIITVSFGKYDLAGVLVMSVYPAALFVLGEVSFKDSLKKIWILLPFVCFVGIFNPIFDRQPALLIGDFIITAGMISMVTLILKGILSVLASYLLIATTNIEKICYALRILHVPTILVTEILLAYRYISVLLNEAGRIIDAYSLRAPGQKGVHFKVWGSLAGQLLLRSMDRASAVYESMTLRGYSGEFYYGEKRALNKKDCFYFLVWTSVFTGVKLI